MTSKRDSLRFVGESVVAEAWNATESLLLYDSKTGTLEEANCPSGMSFDDCIEAAGGYCEFASVEIGPGAYVYLRRSLIRGVYELPQDAVNQMVFPELRGQPWSVVQMVYQRPLAESGHKGRPSERDLAIMEPMPVDRMAELIQAPAVRPPEAKATKTPPNLRRLRELFVSLPLSSLEGALLAVTRIQCFAVPTTGDSTSFLVDASRKTPSPAPLAVIDLSMLDARLGLPAKGCLQFFYDVESQPWGGDVSGVDAFGVSFSESYTSQDRMKHRGCATPIEFQAGIGLPALGSADGDALGLGSEGQEEAYLSLIEELYGEPGRPGGVPGTWLGGYPYQLQDEMPEQCAEMARKVWGIESEPSAWHLLLQLASEPAASMNWGDGGFLYYWIRESDLDARDFSRVWCVLQSM